MKSIISTWPLASRLDWFGNYDTKIIGGFLSQRCIPIPLFFFLISMSWMTERFSDLKYWYYIMSTKIWALTFKHKELFKIDWSTQKFKWTLSSNTKRRDWVRKKYLKKNRWVLSHITRFALNTQMQLFILPAGEMKSNCLTYIGLKINQN